MSKSREMEDGYDDDSWQKMKSKVEQESCDESESLNKLTITVLQGFVNRLDMELTGIMKQCPQSQGENQDSLIPMQKKQKTCNGNKKQKKVKHIPKKIRQGDENMQNFIGLGLEPPPDIPEAFKTCIEDMGGTEIKLVIQKFIRLTDLDPQQNRMSMPLKQVKCEFLNDEEKAKLSRREAIKVVLVEPRVVVSELNMNKWDVGKTGSSYVLNGPSYKNVVKNNEDSLKPSAVVQIWSFRVGTNSQLGFALVKVRDGEQD